MMATRSLATLLFTDIVNSTGRAAELGDRGWGKLLQAHHARVRALLRRYDGREIKTIGDGFLAAFDSPTRAIACAWSIREGLREIGLEVRCGLHMGQIDLAQGDVRGMAVHAAGFSHQNRAGARQINSLLQLWVGGLLIELGRPREAIPFLRALRYDNELRLLAPGLYRMGMAYDSMGERDSANAAYEDFARIWRFADSDMQERVTIAFRRGSN